MQLGVLVSGGLGLDLLQHLFQKEQISFVLTDKGSLPIVQFCKDNSVPVFAGNPRNGKAADFIRGKEIDVLVSINYLFIVERDLISLPKLLAFNIHGSLLPKYRGRTPHVWAIINGENETGITAHKIDEGCDTGDIIESLQVYIDPNDTGNDILLKFKLLYPKLVDAVLEKIKSGTIVFKAQDNSLATYFGKRTPVDGQINWNWNKERIRNWVRAQAHPYPGAFTYCNGEKVIIHRLDFDSMECNFDLPNGQIVKVVEKGFFVKVPDGVVRILNFEMDKLGLLKPGILLK